MQETVIRPVNKNTMRKWIIILVSIIITAVIGYNYIYQDHRSIENESAAFVMSSVEIATLFSENAVSSEQKFLNKTIEVSGLISELNTNNITIEDNVFCQFSKDLKQTLDKNSKVNIKGRVIGYDDLLEQVKLDQCTLIHNSQ
jgi:predicted negative regulator of RcsB-dependent stress response